MNSLSLNLKRILKTLIELINSLEKVEVPILKLKTVKLNYLNWVGLNSANLRRLKVKLLM